jgi:hypothetical protein
MSVEWTRALAVTLALSAVGCRVELDQEELGEPAFSQARELCVIPPPAGVQHGGGFSLDFPGGAYWIFSDTSVERPGGTRFQSSSGALASREPACAAGALAYVRDGAGEIAEIIPLTPDELAANATSTDGARIAIWPVSGFVHEQVGFLYFQKVELRGFFDVIVIGTGIARVRFGETAERLSPARYVHEPTLLWLDPQSSWAASGALLAADGFAYVYGCHQLSVFDRVCRVGRVAPARAAEPAAYQYFTGDGWSSAPEQSAIMLQGTDRVSVAYNRWLGKYVALHVGLLENRVLARTAESPFGPFDPPIELYSGTAPSSFWIRDVEQHPAHAAGGDRRIVTSYFSSPPDAEAGTRLVEVVLE